jgi:hypothetical protein
MSQLQSGTGPRDCHCDWRALQHASHRCILRHRHHAYALYEFGMSVQFSKIYMLGSWITYCWRKDMWLRESMR